MSKIARDNRNREIALIQIGKAELAKRAGMTPQQYDQIYRDMLHAVARVDSAAKLDHAGRARVLDHMRAKGVVFGPKAPDGKTTRAVKTRLTPTQRKIWSLWQQLADANLVADRTMPGLMAFVTRQTGVARLEWLKSAQESLVIESLKRWLNRRAEPPHGH